MEAFLFGGGATSFAPKRKLIKAAGAQKPSNKHQLGSFGVSCSGTDGGDI